MQGKGSKRDQKTPEWWSKEVDEDTKVDWQAAVEDYFDAENVQLESTKFSMSLVKEIIPYIALVDKNWEDFPLASFNITDHRAHGNLYHNIRNKIRSMQNTELKKKDDAGTEIVIDKLQSQTKENLDVEEKQSQHADRGFKTKSNQIIAKTADVKSNESTVKKVPNITHPKMIDSTKKQAIVS